jgi:5-methylcytosine-specific restriction endonuclease McrA
MTKKDRQIVFNKYKGRCAYCGCELQKGWHVDHLEPIYRNLYKKGCMRPENENKDNLMPSCASCNNYKNTFGLETFRKEIGLLVSRLNSTFTQYKIAKRFGLVSEIQKKVIFYFETTCTDRDS